MKKSTLRPRTRGGTQRNRGTSIVEVVISLTLLTMLLGSMGIVSRTSDRAYRRGSAESDVELRAGISTQAIVAELEMALSSTVLLDETSPAGSSVVAYRRLEDVIGSDVVTSPPRVLRFEYEAAELDNGVDDDGDRLVDEGRVVLVEEPGTIRERRRVLVTGVAEHLDGEEPNGVDDNGNGLVDERGFLVRRRGDVLDVSVTLVRWASTDAESIARTVETSIMLRN